MNYSNDQIRNFSKKNMVGNWGAAVLLMILVSIITSLISQLFASLGLGAGPSFFPPMTDDPEILAHYYMQSMQGMTSFLSISVIVTGIITSIFNLGIDFGYLNTADGGKLKLEHLIAGFTDNTIKNIIVVVIRDIIISVGFLLLIIPGIVLSFMLVPINYILKDYPEMDIMDMLKTSRQMMKGEKFNYFKLILPYIILPFVVIFGGIILSFVFMANEVFVLGIILVLVTIIASIIIGFWTAIKSKSVTAEFYRNKLNPEIKERTIEEIYVDSEGNEVNNPSSDEYIVVEEEIIEEDPDEDN